MDMRTRATQTLRRPLLGQRANRYKFRMEIQMQPLWVGHRPNQRSQLSNQAPKALGNKQVGLTGRKRFLQVQRPACLGVVVGLAYETARFVEPFGSVFFEDF